MKPPIAPSRQVCPFEVGFHIEEITSPPLLGVCRDVADCPIPPAWKHHFFGVEAPMWRENSSLIGVRRDSADCPPTGPIVDHRRAYTRIGEVTPYAFCSPLKTTIASSYRWLSSRILHSAVWANNCVKGLLCGSNRAVSTVPTFACISIHSAVSDVGALMNYAHFSWCCVSTASESCWGCHRLLDSISVRDVFHATLSALCIRYDKSCSLDRFAFSPVRLCHLRT